VEGAGWEVEGEARVEMGEAGDDDQDQCRYHGHTKPASDASDREDTAIEDGDDEAARAHCDQSLAADDEWNS